MIGAARNNPPELCVRVLFAPDADDDRRVARLLADAAQTQALTFSSPTALLDDLREQRADAACVVVVCAGVAKSEALTQQLLRINHDLHTILLAGPDDQRSLGERFRTIPIRARQLELLPQRAGNLAERVALVAQRARERQLHNDHLTHAEGILHDLRPRPLDASAVADQRQLLDALPVGVALVNSDGFVVRTNVALRRILDLDDSGLAPAHSLTELLPEWSTGGAGAPATDQTITRNRMGRTQHLRLQPSSVAATDGSTSTVLVVEDVTAQEEARRVLTATREELEQRLLHDHDALLKATEERDSIKHFIAALTHDLRSPVAAALLSTQLLQRHPQLRQAGPDALLQRVGRNLVRLERMVDDLLDLTRHDMGNALQLEPEPTELGVLLQDTLDELIALYGKPIALNELPADTNGEWDQEALRRIIENLGSNAVKYGSPDKPAEVSLRADADTVTLSFCNYGPPIPLKVQKVIFEPFFRVQNPAHRHVPGWGVGLALVRVLTERLGGSVTLSSTSERTIFSVRLPRCMPR